MGRMPGARGRAELDFGPFTFFGAGGGGQYKQRFSIDIDDRVLRQEQWAQVGARLKLTRRISLTGTGSSRVYRFESAVLRGVDVKESLDRNSLSASLEGRLAITSLTTLLLSAEGIEDRFLSAGLSTTPNVVLGVPTSDPLVVKDPAPRVASSPSATWAASSLASAPSSTARSSPATASFRARGARRLPPIAARPFRSAPRSP